MSRLLFEEGKDPVIYTRDNWPGLLNLYPAQGSYACVDNRWYCWTGRDYQMVDESTVPPTYRAWALIL